MLTVSYTAGEHLDLMLAEANAHDDAVIRVIVEGDVISLKIDTARLGDTTFDHGGESRTCHRRAGLGIACRHAARC